MPKRSDLSSDLMTMGLFAPMVIAARLQMLALESLRPTVGGRRETVRMTTEKSAAAMEGALAAQKQLVESGWKLWGDMARRGTAFAMSAPALSLAAAARPARSRVRANARRLSRRP